MWIVNIIFTVVCLLFAAALLSQESMTFFQGFVAGLNILAATLNAWIVLHIWID